MSTRPVIFISAVSHELHTARDLVALSIIFRYLPCITVHISLAFILQNITMPFMSSSEQLRPFHPFISPMTGKFSCISAALAASLKSRGVVGEIQIYFREEKNNQFSINSGLKSS